MAETKLADNEGDPSGPTVVYQLLSCVSEPILVVDDGCTATDEHQYMLSINGYDDGFGTAYLDDDDTKLCQGKTD